MKSVPLGSGAVTLVSDEDFDRVMAAGPWQLVFGEFALPNFGSAA